MINSQTPLSSVPEELSSFSPTTPQSKTVNAATTTLSRANVTNNNNNNNNNNTNTIVVGGPPKFGRTVSYEAILNENLNEKVILNVGGQRFETHVQTLERYPESLLGVMFAGRNKGIRRPDSNGEYFFDRDPHYFTPILNYYRVGKIELPPGCTKRMMKEELDYFQIPVSILKEGETLGNRLSKLSLRIARQKVEPKLLVIGNYINAIAQSAAEQGLQSITIEFKSSHQEFYSFLSNFSHRELLLHDLLAQNLDVSFSDMTSSQGHSYILNITLWTRFTTQKISNTLSAVTRILDELRQGVEVKTNKNDHILSIKKY